MVAHLLVVISHAQLLVVPNLWTALVLGALIRLALMLDLRLMNYQAILP